MFRRTAVVVVMICAAWLLLSFFGRGHDRVTVIGPIIHARIHAVSQDIDLKNPPAGYVPIVWKPGDPYIDPGEFENERAVRFTRESWFRRWLRKLCCVLFSCHPEPPETPSDANSEPTTVTAGVNFEGIPASTFEADGDTAFSTPDPVGDVGTGYYVQAVNSAFQVFDKAGNALTSPLLIKVLWSGKDSPCNIQAPIDPIVRYDRAADRWLISGFVWKNFDGANYLCIAVSKTGDPVNGGWYLYELQSVRQISDEVEQMFSIDSPKISVWPNAYYLSTFEGIGKGIDVWALEREKMLDGQSTQPVSFHLPSPDIALLPGDPDGAPPPPESPGWFARQVDGERVGDGVDRVEIYRFSVDWDDPESASFGLASSLTVDPFDSMICTTGNILNQASLLDFCVPQPAVQPAVSQKLETLGFWPQWRLQYRNMGSHESLLFNHTIDTDGAGHAGIRWYELRRPPGGAWAVAQTGTLKDQDLHYFMGGISMDGDGNIALGYAASSADKHPGIRIAHRMAGDAPGSMPGTEFQAYDGTGSQLPPNGKWGDYSTMDVDPVDDCTFWYTHEYYEMSSESGWHTRIVSFKLPGCN